MIMNQTVKNYKKAKGTKILPKYTIAKMLLAHFLMYKDIKEEINEFYNCVSRGLDGELSKTSKATQSETLCALAKRTEFVKRQFHYWQGYI